MTFDFSTIEEVRLGRGNHASASEGLCFMEMAAWFAGEKHSDEPACACPVLGTYGIRINDAMPDDLRDRLLKPLVPMVVGTRDKASEKRRAEFLAMWAISKVLPIMLRARGFADHADACARARTLEGAAAAARAAAAAAVDAAAAARAARGVRGATYAAADAAAAAAVDAAAAARAARGVRGATYAAADAAAAAEAVDAAADVAYAAADAAARAAAAADEIWPVAVEGLRRAILIGRHDGFADPEPVIIERRERLRELVHIGREF